MNKQQRQSLFNRASTIMNTMGRPLPRWQSEYAAGWTVPTEFGEVLVTYFGPTDHKATPWLACRLLDWDAPRGSFNWRGFDHWKQNLHVNRNTTPDQFIDAMRRHLSQFNPTKTIAQ